MNDHHAVPGRRTRRTGTVGTDHLQRGHRGLDAAVGDLVLVLKCLCALSFLREWDREVTDGKDRPERCDRLHDRQLQEVCPGQGQPDVP